MPDYSKNYEIAYDEPSEACTIRFRCFDTPNSVTLFSSGLPDRGGEALLIEAKNRCLELHRLWSFSLPGSDISRINEPCTNVEVDEYTARLLRAMKEFHGIEPAFDFTVGPVSYAWKHATAVPPKHVIREALEHVGADKVEIDGCTVVKRDPLVQVDVGGAAKGFAADEIAALLRDAGIACADIDLGGNLYMLGKHPSGRPWRVSVRVPEGKGPILEVVDQSVVTSGVYERFVEIGGIRYNHIVDVRTGWPTTCNLESVSVVSSSSLRADMLATTAFLEGIDALQERHPHERFVVLAATDDT